MSKITAFLLSCVIYFSIFFLVYFAGRFFLAQKESVQYGNSNINILFVQDLDELSEEIKQDYTKEVANKINENIQNLDKKNEEKVIKKESNNIPEKTIENLVHNEENFDPEIADLFGDLNITKSEKKPQKVKLSTEQLESLKNLQNQLANTTIKSSNNSKKSKTSVKVAGIYDEYFGKVNAYLKNVWSLITANSATINEKEFFEVAFRISKAGIIKLDDNGFAENSALKHSARVFIKTINQQNKNLGIPPNQQDYSGSIRLSVILSIKEIK